MRQTTLPLMANYLMFLEVNDPSVLSTISTRAKLDISTLPKALEMLWNPSGEFPERASAGVNQFWIGIEVPVIVGVGQKQSCE